MKEYSTQKPSAQVILPIVRELIPFNSVIDVGCGIGAWLKVCKDLGATKICGIDANVPTEDLIIDKDTEYIKADLTDIFYKNGQPQEKQYDLVISLEVAEHIPEKFADIYLLNLTSFGDIILFSAAIPGQGGVEHVNEQWPSYWKKKFATYGYIPLDIIRRRIWDRDDVGWPYMQNIMFYVNSAVLSDNGKITVPEDISNVMDLVHPKYYLRHALLLPNETKKTFILKKILRGLKLLIFGGK